MANRCTLCKDVAELVDHLFIHCDVAWSLWMFIFNLLGPTGSCLLLLVAFFRVSGLRQLARNPEVVWDMVLHALFGHLWKERNLKTFEEMEASVGDLKYTFVKTFWWLCTY